MSGFSLLFGYLGDGGPRDDLFRWVLDWWDANFPEAQVCVGHNFDTPFHRGKARNAAARMATEDLFVIADADTVPQALAVRQGLRMVEKQRARWVIPYDLLSYYNLTEEYTARFLQQPAASTQLPEFVEGDWDHQLTAWAGVLIVPRAAFETVGGYDERFVGWGAEDRALQHALDVMVGPHERIAGARVAHLWHPRGDAGFHQPHWPHNEALLRRYQRARTQIRMRAVLDG